MHKSSNKRSKLQKNEALEIEKRCEMKEVTND